MDKQQKHNEPIRPADAKFQEAYRSLVNRQQTQAERQKKTEELVLGLVRLNPSEALTIATGVFISLLTSYMRAQGLDITKKIKIDGCNERDITVHAIKAGFGSVNQKGDGHG